MHAYNPWWIITFFHHPTEGISLVKTIKAAISIANCCFMLFLWAIISPLTKKKFESSESQISWEGKEKTLSTFDSIDLSSSTKYAWRLEINEIEMVHLIINKCHSVYSKMLWIIQVSFKTMQYNTLKWISFWVIKPYKLCLDRILCSKNVF